MARAPGSGSSPDNALPSSKGATSESYACQSMLTRRPSAGRFRRRHAAAMRADPVEQRGFSRKALSAQTSRNPRCTLARCCLSAVTPLRPNVVFKSSTWRAARRDDHTASWIGNGEFRRAGDARCRGCRIFSWVQRTAARRFRTRSGCVTPRRKMRGNAFRALVNDRSGDAWDQCVGPQPRTSVEPNDGAWRDR